MSPDLEILAEFVLKTDQWEREGDTFSDLLGRLLPLLQSTHAQIESLQAYLLEKPHIRAIATSDAAASLEEISTPSLSSCEALLENSKAALEEDGRVLFAGDILSARPLILEWRVEGAVSDDLRALLAVASAQIAQAYLRRTAQDMIDRHTLMTRELADCETFRDIAGVLGRHMAAPGQFISINLTEYDINNHLTGLRTVATGNRSKAFDADMRVAVDVNELPDALRQLFETGEAAYLRDMQDDTQVGENFRQWNAGRPIRSVCMVPMRFQDRLFGLIALNAVNDVVNMNPQEISLLRALADEIGVLVRLHDMTQETRFSHDISERQALVFGELVTGQDITSMAGTVAYHMLPQDTRCLSLHAIDYEAEAPVGWQLMASYGPETSAVSAVSDLLWDMADPKLRAVRPDGAPYVIEDLEELGPEATSAVFVEWLSANSIRAMLSVPIIAGTHMVAILSVFDRTANSFGTEEVRAFQNIAELIGALIHNQQVLQDAESNLNEVRLLYDLNRDLLASEDKMEVLRALRTHLASDAVSLILVSFGWDEMRDDLTSLVIACRLNRQGEFYENNERISQLSPEQIVNLRREWAYQGEEVDIISDLGALLEERPALIHSYNVGVRASVVIPIYSEGYIRQQITITFEEPRHFDAATRRLFETARDQIAVVLENQRLLADTQTAAARLGNQVRILQTINHLATRLPSLQDEKLMLDETVEALVHALAVSEVCVALHDATASTSHIISAHPLKNILGAQVEAFPRLPGHDETRPALISADDFENTLPIQWRRLATLLGSRNLGLLPLLNAQRVQIGILVLSQSKENKPIPSEAIDTASTIAAQVAVALQNVRLLHDTQRQARQLEYIAGFGQAIQTTLEIESLLDIALMSAGQVLEADHISVAFYDPPHSRLNLIAWRDSQRDVIVALDNPQPVLAGTTMNQVWEQRLPLQLDDLMAQAELRHHSREDLRSIISMPIFSRGSARGVIEIGNVKASAYRSTDGAVFQQLTNQLSVAIENAEAYTQSRRVAMTKARANEISTRIQQQWDMDEIMSVTMQELGQTLKARKARIRLKSDLEALLGEEDHDTSL